MGSRVTPISTVPHAPDWYRRFAFTHRAALLIGVSAMLLGHRLGARILSTNDEARFPMLARDILSGHHWLLPRLDGVPHLNKPPLQAWLVALASWPTGAVTQWTAAIPSVLAALLVVFTTYRIALRLFDRDAALVGGLTVLTTVGVASYGRIPMPDMTFCAAVTGALAAYIAAELGGHRWALIAFYGLVGLAFWSKGPAGLLPLVVAAVDLGIADGAPGLRRLICTPGLLLLAVLIGAWGALIMVAPNEAQFGRDVVMHDVLSWYVPTRTPNWRQLFNPLGQALTIVLPWSVLLPGAIWMAAREREPVRRRRARLLLAWAGVMFLLLAVTREQRMRYYLPLCPPAALLLAGWYASWRSPRRAPCFASAWVLVVLAGLTVDSYAGARQNAATDLREASRRLTHAARIYAVDAPELVFSFYLGRPVTILRTCRDFDTRVQSSPDEYVIVPERAIADSPCFSLRQVATATVHGRRFAILESGPPLSTVPTGRTTGGA